MDYHWMRNHTRDFKNIKKNVKENQAEVERMGYDINDIGVHRIWKVAATDCCSGTTAAPHIAAVSCNLVGWRTMGNKVKDVYIKYSARGTCSGRTPCSKCQICLFTSLFPCETSYNAECGDRECTVEDIDYSIATLFPNFEAVTIWFN